MPRSLDRKFIDIDFHHDLIGHLSVEVRMKQSNPTSIKTMYFYLDPFVIQKREDGSHLSVPEIAAHSPKDVIEKLQEFLDISAKSKNLNWIRYVRLKDNFDLHHLFYNQNPVVHIEEYYFAYDKSEQQWYQTATPRSPIPVASEQPPTEKWIPCDDDNVFYEIKELSTKRSDEIRSKMIQIKEELHLKLRAELEVLLGVRHSESHETNDFEKILQNYKDKG